MALDVLAGVGPKTRARAHKLGRQYGSEVTRDQAADFLMAQKLYPQLADYGIVPPDVTRMAALHQATVVMLAAVGEAGAGKKVTNTAYNEALARGKAARRAARAVLGKAERILREQETEASEALADRIDTILAQSARAGADSEKLGAQLIALGALLADPAIAAVCDATLLAKVGKALADEAATLAKATRTDARRGGSANEDADVVDGLIIELCREWRAAARVAATELGSPAIADAFELRRLYPEKHTRKPGSPPA